MPSSSPKKNDTDSKTNTPPSRMVVLKLASTLLSRFPSDSPAVDDKEIKVKDASSSPSSTSGEAGLQASSLDNASDAASTPAGASASAGAGGAGSEGDKAKGKKGTAATARGTKRALNQNGEPGSKPPRSRPSAKKRMKLDEKALDTSKLLPPNHKLGPKANQGAINAGLRALDRSGAPCRKWERKSFQLKSFTGVVWGLSSWHTPKPQQTVESSGEEVSSGVAAVANGADSDSKDLNGNPMSSAVPSEKSNPSLPPSTAQSPTPVLAMTA